jgi:hypothetical protein
MVAAIGAFFYARTKSSNSSSSTSAINDDPYASEIDTQGEYLSTTVDSDPSYSVPIAISGQGTGVTGGNLLIDPSGSVGPVASSTSPTGISSSSPNLNLPGESGFSEFDGIPYTPTNTPSYGPALSGVGNLTGFLA